MSVRARAISAVRWTSFVTATRVLLQSIQLFVLARLLTSQDFGMMAMILTVTAFVQLFADLGVSSVIIHARTISDNVLSTLYWLNLGMGAALSLTVAATSPLLAAFLGEPRVAMPLALAGLSFLALALGQQIKVLAEKRLDFRTVAIVEFCSALASTVIGIGSACAGAGVYALVLATLSLSAGNSLLYWIFARTDWQLRFNFHFNEAKPYLASGMYLLGTSLANTASVQADVLIVGRLLGSTLLGFYTLPRELCLKVMMATNPIITRVGTPLLAEVQHDKARIRRIYLGTVAMTSAINFPLYGMIAAFRHDVTAIAFGARWASSANLLGVFALWGMFRSIGNPVGSLLYGTGRTQLALVQALIVTIALVVAVSIATRWGALGTAIGLTLFYFGLTFGIWAGVIRPITGATLTEYCGQWLMPLLATAIAAALALFATLPLTNHLLRLAAGGMVGGIGYLTASWFLNREWATAMLSLVGRREARS